MSRSLKHLLQALAREFRGFRFYRDGTGYQCGYIKGQRWNKNQKPMHEIKRRIDASPFVQIDTMYAWWMIVRPSTAVIYRATV